MTDLWLVRHGETDWNRELRFQGQVDPPLNATGHTQSQRLASHLPQYLDGARIDALYSSDLLRARQTAAPLADLLGLAARPEVALREQHFGVIDGLSVAEIQARHPDEWARFKRFDPDASVPQGESLRALHARVMQRLWALVAAHPGQQLLLVTHGGVLDMLYRSSQGLPLAGPRQCLVPNAGLGRLRAHDGVLQLLNWAEVVHLQGLPPQPVYDQARVNTAD